MIPVEWIIMVENVKPDSSIEEEFKLFNLTDVDRATLRQTDEQFVPHDWEELKTIVGKAPNLNRMPLPKPYSVEHISFRRSLTSHQRTTISIFSNAIPPNSVAISIGPATSSPNTAASSTSSAASASAGPRRPQNQSLL